jgi:hypothetical protein
MTPTLKIYIEIEPQIRIWRDTAGLTWIEDGREDGNASLWLTQAQVEELIAALKKIKEIAL